MPKKNGCRRFVFDIFQKICTLFGALWLIGDLVSDIANTKQYYDMAAKLNGNSRFYEPSFLYQENNKTALVREACFFYASTIALVLPIPVGLILVLIFLMYDYSTNLKRWPTGCCKNKCCGKFCGIFLSILFLPLTFIIAVILSILIVPIAWIFSPFLHIARALFALFGAKPVDRSSPIQDESFKRFWTFVLLLGVMEQIFEALPQTFISGVYFYLEEEPCLDSNSLRSCFWQLYENHKTQVISLIFSAGSLLLFMTTNIFQYTFNRPNSFLGLINSLKEESHTKRKKSLEKINDIECLSNENNEKVLQITCNLPPELEKRKSRIRTKVTAMEEETPLLQTPVQAELVDNIDAEQEKTSAIIKENTPLKARQVATLCITGFGRTTDPMNLVRFIIKQGVPQDIALTATFSLEGCECLIDNLDIHTCAGLVTTLHGLEFEGKLLHCTRVIKIQIIRPASGNDIDESNLSMKKEVQFSLEEEEDENNAQKLEEKTNGFQPRSDFGIKEEVSPFFVRFKHSGCKFKNWMKLKIENKTGKSNPRETEMTKIKTDQIEHLENKEHTEIDHYTEEAKDLEAVNEIFNFTNEEPEIDNESSKCNLIEEWNKNQEHFTVKTSIIDETSKQELRIIEDLDLD